MIIKKQFYLFKTEIKVSAPVSAVFVTAADARYWKSWWRGIRKISLIDICGPQNLLILRCTLGFWFYNLDLILTIDKVHKNKYIHLLTQGDLEGFGAFSFEEKSDITKICFVWEVYTTKTWMNVVGIFAKPIFVYSHNLVMRWFAEGLSNYLKVRLISIKHFGVS